MNITTSILDLRDFTGFYRDWAIERAIIPIDIPGAVIRQTACDTDVLWTEPNGEKNSQWFGAERFRYATSVDAILPLLEQYRSSCIRGATGWTVRLYETKPLSGELADFITCDFVANEYASTLPLAACYALLRAHGMIILS